jgi:hypothetical protein
MASAWWTIDADGTILQWPHQILCRVHGREEIGTVPAIHSGLLLQ